MKYRKNNKKLTPRTINTVAKSNKAPILHTKNFKSKRAMSSYGRQNSLVVYN